MSGEDAPELSPLLTERPSTDNDYFEDASSSSHDSRPNDRIRLQSGQRRPIISDAELASHLPSSQPSRSLEDDVLPETSTLGRTLTWQSAYIIIISRVIGSGIFATPGIIVQAVGSPGLSLTLWVVGAVFAACGLAASLEYGCMMPRSGGDKVYLEFTYRRPKFLASTLVAVQAVLLGFTASNCIVFSEYVLFAAEGWSGDGSKPASDALRKGLAVGLLATVTVIHGVFPKLGVRVQNVLGWTKVGVVLFMLLCSVYVLLFRPNADQSSENTGTGTGGTGISAQPSSSWDRLWQDSIWNWGTMATSFFKVFYSFAGLDNVSNVLNEVKDPVRTLKSASLTALATACSMYLLINVAYFLVVPLEDIKGSGELIAALFFEQIFGKNIGRKVLPLAVALSAGGNVFVVAFAMARLKQEIARQGFLPFSDTLSSTKPFGSPLGGFLVHFIPSFLVIVLPPSGTVYSFILEVEGYPSQLFSAAVGIGLIWLRFKRPELQRPFKAWLPAVALKVVLSGALLAAPFFPPKERNKGGLFYATYAIVGISIILGGVLYWFVWTILVPRWKGYELAEEEEVLMDGTTITRLVHKTK